MKLHFAFLIISISALPALQADESPPPLTLAQAVAQAQAHNPGIQEARAEWAAAREHAAQAGAWDDLQLGAMSRLARFVSIPRNGFADQTLSLSQAIPLSGRNLLRARAATAQALVAYEESRRRELDVIAQTKASYFHLANARAQVELNRRDLVLLNQIAQVSQARYEAGGQSAAEVLAAQTEAGRLLETASDLARAAADEQTQLDLLMGSDPFTPIGEIEQPPAQCPDLPAGRLRALALANRPEIRGAQDRLDAAQAALELARRAWIPDPTFSIEGQRYNSAGQALSELDAGISFNIPWTNGPKYRAATREAACDVAAARYALDQSRLEAMALLEDSLEDIETSRHHQHLTGDTLLDQARNALKANEIGYESGKASLMDWITAAGSLRDIESMLVQHRSDAAAALAQLEAVIGASPASTPGSTSLNP